MLQSRSFSDSESSCSTRAPDLHYVHAVFKFSIILESVAVRGVMNMNNRSIGRHRLAPR
jgi:hypothetical protein